jgi:hypothetical protein
MVAVSTSLRRRAGTFLCNECNSRSQITGNESSSSGGRGRGVLRSKIKKLTSKRWKRFKATVVVYDVMEDVELIL